MEQNNPQKNKNESFFQKNQNYIIAGVIVLLLIIYFATQKPANTEQAQEDQNTEQTSSDSTETPSTETSDKKEDEKMSADSQEKKPETAMSSDKKAEEKPKTETKTESMEKTPETSGNLTVSGTLMKSDNPSKGNLMVMKGASKYYVSTKRDFSAWTDKQVTLLADGTAKDYKFLGFKEASTAKSDTAMNVGRKTDSTAKGGNNEAPDAMMNKTGDLTFSGTLKKSTDSSKGNYVIETGKTKVFLKTNKDFSSWENKEVSAKAMGTISNFTGLVLTEKK